jgi:hypothetical protein
MVEEKRKSPRANVRIDARWEGVLTRHFGTVTDISRTGCFILTVDAVAIKELLRVEIQLLSGKWIYVWGEVVYRAPEIGFGLRFTGASEEEEKMIALLIEYVNKEKALADGTAEDEPIEVEVEPEPENPTEQTPSA